MISIKNLTKNYKNKLILDNLNLELESGQIIGLLGENGAGKSTLMKILTNIVIANNGQIFINNEALSYATNKYISYLPEVPFLDKNLSIKAAINEFKYFHKDFDMEKANRLLNELKLDSNSKIKTLSKGMIEKLHLILILSRNTKIYLLDEPIAGVDIITRKQVLKLIIDNVSEDSLVIITTHLIKDIEQIFDKFCFIKDGKLSEIFLAEDIRTNSNMSIEEYYIEYFGGNKNV